jgi:glycosyltransferase involved in cell wall biosynthesis
MSRIASDRPRVLMAADVLSTKDTGLGRHQWYLARELERQGFSVRELYTEDVAGGGPSPLRRFSFPLAVLREARRGPGDGRGYDIAVVHEGSAALLCLARKLGLAATRCMVVSHNPEQKAWEMTLARAARGQIAVSAKSRWIWPLTRLSQSNFALKHADAVFCLSEEDVQFICSRYGRSPAQVQRISNGVEDRFLACRCEFAEPRILFLGTWLPHKGTRELRSALAAVLERNPRAGASLVGVGVHEESVEREFPERLRGRIRIASRVSPEELPAVFSSHNIFVLPSWTEGMPLALLEAMASGLAVVVTAVGGMRDIVRHEVDGLSIPSPDDPAGIEAALERLSTDARLRTHLGAMARERAREYTWERAGQALARLLYAELGEPLPATAGIGASHDTRPNSLGL